MHRPRALPPRRAGGALAAPRRGAPVGVVKRKPVWTTNGQLAWADTSDQPIIDPALDALPPPSSVIECRDWQTGERSGEDMKQGRGWLLFSAVVLGSAGITRLLDALLGSQVSRRRARERRSRNLRAHPQHLRLGLPHRGGHPCPDGWRKSRRRRTSRRARRAVRPSAPNVASEQCLIGSRAGGRPDPDVPGGPRSAPAGNIVKARRRFVSPQFVSGPAAWTTTDWATGGLFWLHPKPTPVIVYTPWPLAFAYAFVPDTTV